MGPYPFACTRALKIFEMALFMAIGHVDLRHAIKNQISFNKMIDLS